MAVVSLMLRTWLRYLVPLTVLSAIVLAPIAYVAIKSGAPTNVATARAQVRLGWILAGSAWVFQLWLVAAAAPLVRAVAAGTPLSQARALLAGVRSLGRGFVPWLLAIAAVVLGGVALVVPGMLLLVLLSLTGASEQLGAPPPAPLVDSIAVVREQLPRVAVVVAAIVAVDLAITYAAQLAFVPAVGKKVAAVKLLPIRTFVTTTAAALIVASPLAACGLAALYSHAKRR